MAMKPTLQALVLADHVYQDVRTTKMVIAGTFNRIQIRKPTETLVRRPDGTEQQVKTVGPDSGSPSLYISLTEVRGETPLELRLVSLDDYRVLAQIEVTVGSNDPVRTTELAIHPPRLPIPHVGVYALELLCDNEPLGAHRLEVIWTPEAEQGSDNVDEHGRLNQEHD